METIRIRTKTHNQVLDITEEVQSILAQKGEGVCTVFIKHTTCAIATADLDPGTDQDYIHIFEKLIPHIQFNHPHDPSHMPEHILSTLIGTSLCIPFQNGQLQLGTWQRIVLIELSGPREREIVVQT